MDAPKIPGWKPISKDEAFVYGAEHKIPAPQLVNKQWYITSAGPLSLQKLVDEYIDGLWTVYGLCTYEWKDGSVHGKVSDGDRAIQKLKEFGLVDDEGRVMTQ